MALETSFHHLTAQVSSVLALNSPAIFPYGSPGVLSHRLKLLMLTLPGRAQIWSAHKLSTGEGRKGTQGHTAPQAPTGQECARPKPEWAGKTLYLGCARSQTGLEKAELSGQDTTLCPQLNLPSLDQQTSEPLSTSPLSEQQLHLGSSILRPSTYWCWARESFCIARAVGHVPRGLGDCT